MRTLLALLVFAPGCFAVLESEYGTFPSDDAVASVVPGKTKREEVLELLGPPEEYRHPTVEEEQRSFSPPILRIRDEHRVFDLSTMTYSREEDVRRSLSLIVFSISWFESRADRLIVTLDRDGVVQDLSIAKRPP